MKGKLIAIVMSTQNPEGFRLSHRLVVISYSIPYAELGYIML